MLVFHTSMCCSEVLRSCSRCCAISSCCCIWLTMASLRFPSSAGGCRKSFDIWSRSNAFSWAYSVICVIRWWAVLIIQEEMNTSFGTWYQNINKQTITLNEPEENRRIDWTIQEKKRFFLPGFRWFAEVWPRSIQSYTQKFSYYSDSQRRNIQ